MFVAVVAFSMMLLCMVNVFFDAAAALVWLISSVFSVESVTDSLGAFVFVTKAEAACCEHLTEVGWFEDATSHVGMFVFMTSAAAACREHLKLVGGFEDSSAPGVRSWFLRCCKTVSLRPWWQRVQLQETFSGL